MEYPTLWESGVAYSAPDDCPETSLWPSVLPMPQRVSFKGHTVEGEALHSTTELACGGWLGWVVGGGWSTGGRGVVVGGSVGPRVLRLGSTRSSIGIINRFFRVLLPGEEGLHACFETSRRDQSSCFVVGVRNMIGVRTSCNNNCVRFISSQGAALSVFVGFRPIGCVVCVQLFGAIYISVALHLGDHSTTIRWISCGVTQEGINTGPFPSFYRHHSLRDGWWNKRHTTLYAPTVGRWGEHEHVCDATPDCVRLGSPIARTA